MLKPIELLNQHLDDIITLGGKQYPKERIMRVWEKLNPPIPTGVFYSGERVKGFIGNAGEVSFKTYYPETGWEYNSRSELGIISTMPAPRKELIAMSKAFNDLLDSPQGKIVYTNSPISPHRAKAYQKMGFVPATPLDETLASWGANHTQKLDNRRFQNLPMVKEMYESIPVMYEENLARLPVNDNFVFDDDDWQNVVFAPQVGQMIALEPRGGW